MFSSLTDKFYVLRQIITRIQSSSSPVSLTKLAKSLSISYQQAEEAVVNSSALGVPLCCDQGLVWLKTNVNLIEPERLQAQLSAPLNYHDTLPSTNQFLMERLEGLHHQQVCISEHQSEGRGRRGKVWFSPYGAHLYQSMYWRCTLDIKDCAVLGLVAGIAVVESLRALGVDDVELKWPNDVYRNGRKLGGILVESQKIDASSCHVVIGTGINVFMPEVFQDIEQPVSDLQDLVPHAFNKTDLSYAIWKGLSETLECFIEEGFEPFYQKWHLYDLFYGKKVVLMQDKQQFIGYYRGIDSKGRLLFEYQNQLQAYQNTQVSLRLFSD